MIQGKASCHGCRREYYINPGLKLPGTKPDREEIWIFTPRFTYVYKYEKSKGIQESIFPQGDPSSSDITIRMAVQDDKIDFTYDWKKEEPLRWKRNSL